MIIKVENFQDKAYILDVEGRIWKVEIKFDQPEIRLLHRLERYEIPTLLAPSLARYDRNIVG